MQHPTPVRFSFHAVTIFLKLVVLAAFLGGAAADALAQSGGAAGSWKWTFTRGNGETSTATARIAQDGEKLSGVYVGNDGAESKIEQGAFKNGEVSFQVKRERNGETYVVTYRGKLDGDTITGKSEFAWNDQKRERDWEAQRQKEQASAAGDWTWTYNRDGQDFEITLRLKQNGETVTGVSVWQSGEEASIRNGRLKDGEMTLQVSRDYEGQTLQSEYKGKISGDTFKGTLTTDVGGSTYTFPVEAKRAKK